MSPVMSVVLLGDTAMRWPLPQAEVEPDIAEEITTRLGERERLAEAMTALSALRKPEREVLSLCVFSKLDYSEAAEALGVPIGTVRSRLSRARKKLAKLVAAGTLQPTDENWERPSRHGQITDDRTNAVRLAQEIAQ